MTTAVHAELHEVKSLLQTRTLWLPGLQSDGGGLIDWVGGVPISPWLPGTAWLPRLVVCAPAAPGRMAKKSAINNNMDLVMEAPERMYSTKRFPLERCRQAPSCQNNDAGFLCHQSSLGALA
jgi:hypothetical protein